MEAQTLKFRLEKWGKGRKLYFFPYANVDVSFDRHEELKNLVIEFALCHGMLCVGEENTDIIKTHSKLEPEKSY